MQKRTSAWKVMRHLLWMVLATTAVAAQAAQGGFPVKPVRLLVPNVPGGATDTIARHLQIKLGELWGQPVIVDNRPGASGGNAFALAAKAPADGYTLLGNEAQAAMVNLASSIAHIRAGRMKVLATTWPTRRPELPEVPTMAESGFPGIGTNAWNGLFAPVKMPKPLLNRIHADVAKVMDTPATREQLAKQMITVVVSKSPDEFNGVLAEERKKWRQVVVENNITVQ